MRSKAGLGRRFRARTGRSPAGHTGGSDKTGVARTSHPRRAVAGDLLQFRYKTGLSSEEYVKQRAWNDAIPPPCPWCRLDTCQLAPHGFYRRVKPKGTLVRRFICRTVMRTVSRLPDCYATRVTGSLEEVEEAVATAAGAATRAQAVDWARPPGKGSPATARRWLERRMGWVWELLGTVNRYAGNEAAAEPPQGIFRRCA